VEHSWLYYYQTLVVGVVGFTGVILSLWYNAKIAQDRRDDERRHERKALRAALIAELQINRYSLEENIRGYKDWRSEKKPGGFVPTDRMDGAYQSFLPRIGLLSEDEVGKVMNAYLTLQTYNANLFMLGEPVQASTRLIQVPSTHTGMLVAMQEGVLKPIDEAIKALEKASDK
jgi:hypothetical protein